MSKFKATVQPRGKNEYKVYINGEAYNPLFQDLTYNDYLEQDVKYIVPMTAQEITEDQFEHYFNQSEYYEEIKFDGVRATVHFNGDSHTRIFSRRESVNGWLAENTDSLPQLRELIIPEIEGTILDGELFIPNREFRDTSSTMNCKWDKAVARQCELGFAVFHAFDITHYKGVCIEKMPLYKRKEYLALAVSKINSEYVKSVEFHEKDIIVYPDSLKSIMEVKDKFPLLYREIVDPERCLAKLVNTLGNIAYIISKRAYYEYIVMLGGEGVILKDKNAPYEHKRSKGYLKVKAFITRDVVVTSIEEPTKEYKGKYPKDRWPYWVYKDDENVRLSEAYASEMSANELSKSYKPVSKYWYYDMPGNIVYGVVIEEDDNTIQKLTDKKKKPIIRNVNGLTVLEVGECSGFTEEVRESLKDVKVGSVIEVKANGIFNDTGKMRHPRFHRFRWDKNAEECTWKNHVSN